MALKVERVCLSTSKLRVTGAQRMRGEWLQVQLEGQQGLKHEDLRSHRDVDLTPSPMGNH